MKQLCRNLRLALLIQSALVGQVATAQTIANAGTHNLVLCSDGTLMAWGSNAVGSLGIGTLDSPVLTPILVNTNSVGAVTNIAAAGYASFAINDEGELWSWGYNYWGQLGIGSTMNQSLPVLVPLAPNTTIRLAAAGSFHTVALKDDSTLLAWGRNQFGSVGDNTLVQRNSPVSVSNTYGGGIVEISCGGEHTLALKNDGSVWAWGRSQHGQCGIGGWTTLDEPIQCNGMSDSVVAIAAGLGHSLALKSDGTVWAWGNDGGGQLGNGGANLTSNPNPVQVSGLTDVVRISTVSNASYAVKSDGTVWAWGINAEYLLTGELINSIFDLPQQLSLLGSDPVIFHGLGNNALAIGANGDLLSWGTRYNGVIGDGGPTTGFVTEPIVLTTTCAISTDVSEGVATERTSVFPNPTDGFVTLRPYDGAEHITVYNGMGQVVAQQAIVRDLEAIDLTSCPPGVLVVSITGNGLVERIVVVRD